MSSERRRNLLLGVFVVVACLATGYFLWGEVQRENQRLDLSRFCLNLKLQASLTEVQVSTTLTPRMRLILLDPDAEGIQSGSIYFEDSGPWSCNVTFARGRLMQKSFASGRFVSKPGVPAEKLKPW